MTKQNPFKPTAGRTPPLLIGRQPIIDDFTEALDDGPGAPGRLMRITGARGVGKTVILTKFSEIAEQRGWLTVDETAHKGLIGRLISQLRKPDTELDVEAEIRLPGVRAKASHAVRFDPNESTMLHEIISRRLDELERKHRGLLITIDEAQGATRDDMVMLATTLQHLTRKGRDFAFVFAGLPEMSSKWLNDDVITFMRRAQAETLADVPLAEVRDALSETFTQTGFILRDPDLDRATEATGGYPYMIQLVGYNIWRIAHRKHPNMDQVPVTREDVEQGISDALVRLGDAVHGPEMDGLSSVDKTYLLAMAQDDGPSSTSEIARRMGKGPNYGSMYRNRLLDAHVIKETSFGYVDFAIPYLREYLREHDAYYRMPVEKTPRKKKSKKHGKVKKS